MEKEDIYKRLEENFDALKKADEALEILDVIEDALNESEVE